MKQLKETKVNIQFYIGWRTYYECVIKKGKYYYRRNEKMTKSRGYHGIKEIPHITENMRNDMLSDMYYY